MSSWVKLKHTIAGVFHYLISIATAVHSIWLKLQIPACLHMHTLGRLHYWPSSVSCTCIRFMVRLSCALNVVFVLCAGHLMALVCLVAAMTISWGSTTCLPSSIRTLGQFTTSLRWYRADTIRSMLKYVAHQKYSKWRSFGMYMYMCNKL